MRKEFLRFALLLPCTFLLCNSAPAAPMLISQRHPSIAASSGGNGDSGSPLISSDGRYVLFSSAANNLTTNAAVYPARMNLFRRDRVSGATELISVGTSGSLGNGDSIAGGISADGRYIVFESTANNLVVNDTNNAADIFVRDTIGRTISLLSKPAIGSQTNRFSRSPTMTPDGRYVAFVSDASNLIANDTNGIPDVFVVDRQLATMTLVSKGAEPKSPGFKFGSDCPEISDDGRYVAFFSEATNLVSGVTNSGEVYIRDLLSNTMIWASTNARSLFPSGDANVASFNLALSSDGQHVAFQTCTNNINIQNTNGMIFRFNVASGTTDVVCTNANVSFDVFSGIHNLSITPDGQSIAYIANSGSSNTSVMLWSAAKGTNLLVSSDINTGTNAIGTCNYPVISANGNRVAFISSATTLSATPVSSGFHLYVRDLQNSITTVADIDTNGSGAGVFSMTVPSISADGSVIAFESTDSSLVSNDSNLALDVFTRDLQNQTTELVSAHASGLISLSGNSYSQLSTRSVSSNGIRVVFMSDATDLVLNDTNAQRDIFVRDLLTATNTLVSIGLNGEAADLASIEPAISGNGRYVVFSSFATNLISGDTNNFQDVFLRDLQANTTTLVSRSVNSGFGNGTSYSPVVSHDGHYVMYRSTASNLTSPSSPAAENLFVRDTQLGTNYILTSGPSTTGISASMTPDGHYIAFTGLISGQANSRIYIWNVLTATRIYTNTATSPTQVAISSDGTKLAYLASSIISMANVTAQTNVTIGSAGPSYLPDFHFSQDGRFLAYASASGGFTNLYRYDFNTGATQLVNSTVASASFRYTPGLLDISPDGRFIAYRSLATNLFPSDLNNSPDIFFSDCSNGSLLLLSGNKTAMSTANDASIRPQFSKDGQLLFFQSCASDLASGDLNQRLPDIYAVQLTSTPLVDSDNDGMDDAWELATFNTLTHDGSADSDEDTVSDLAEYQSGTDPSDPASYFHLEVSSNSSSNIQLKWPAGQGLSYRVQFKNSLEDSSWQELPGSMRFFGNWGFQNDSTTSTQKFYRVIRDN